MNIFDYTFYRTYKYFVKKEGDIAKTTAAMTVGLIQFFMLLDLLVFIRLFYEFPLPHKLYIAPVLIIIAFYSWYRYERHFDLTKYEEKWGSEDEVKAKNKDKLIVLWVLIVFLLPVTYGILKHNFGVI